MPLERECEHYGVDVDVVRRFENRINRLLRDMKKEGLYLFCGSSGTIRAYDSDKEGRPLIVGNITGINHDGGDGGCGEDENGLMRGE